MTTLIIPAAGLSTRYGLDRPKFLLRHPKGLTMAAEGISRLNFDSIDEIIFVSLHKYFESIDITKFTSELSAVSGTPVLPVLIEETTSSMVETITVGIRAMNEDDSIILKDTDNLVSIDFPLEKNFIAFGQGSKNPSVPLHNKSFVQLDTNGYVSSIVEKRIVSEYFNTGVVGFNRASEFLSKVETSHGSGSEYVSSIVESLIDDGELFKGVEANSYFDWGTLAEWRDHCSKFSTLFIDIDGVISRNMNPLSHDRGWETIEPLAENVAGLLELYRSGSVHFVFTTSRTENYRTAVKNQLNKVGFNKFDLVMGLPHAKRYLVNDYAATNPYPTAVAINLERESLKLTDLLPPHLEYFPGE